MRKPKILSAPRALASALLSANGYCFDKANDPESRALREYDAKKMLKEFTRLGYRFVPKAKVAK